MGIMWQYMLTRFSGSRITVVGCGAVGMASAFSLLSMGICSDLCLVDARKEICLGEQMDLVHGLAFYGGAVRIAADSDYSVSSNSKICVITAGARHSPDESRLDLVAKNVTIYKSIIPQIMKYNPDTILMVVTNPCDIMAWVAWKISGLPKHKVYSVQERYLIQVVSGI